MRLALKITWIVMVSSGVALGVQANQRLDRELQLIDAQMQRDQRLLGRALLPMLEASYAAGGAVAFERTMDAAFESEREIALRLVRAQDLAPDVGKTLAGGAEVVRVDDVDAAPTLTTYFPLTLAGSDAAALELSEPLTPKARFTETAVHEFVVLLAWLLAITTLIGAGSGYLLVERRVQRLLRAARAVSAGNYTVPPTDDGADELAVLSREMATMTQQLQQASARALAQAERTGQLVQQLRHADRLATVGTLTSRVAHDVGTPLNVIAARAKMIARREVQGDDAVHNAEIIARQSDNLAAKIRELLGFARRRPASQDRIDVQQLVRETQTLLESLARLHEVSIDVGAPAPLSIPGVQLQIQQALVNLTVNAIHAAPRGTAVTITVTVETLDEPPPHAAPGRFAKIAVHDAGEGIPEPLRATIFDAFFTTKADHDGTGLGLPIAAEIVRDHGGFITLDTDSAEGTTFTMMLPEERTDA